MSGVLFVVSTPIGNLEDISFRALEILKNVDYIAAEDTRHTNNLLKYYSIKSDLISCHEWNENKRCEKFINDILHDKSIALVVDSGTPCISDPGFTIIRSFRKAGLDVKTIPGPCALISALSISGLPSDSFYFEGFLPKKKGRKSKLNTLSSFDCTIVIYESPFRINKTLSDIYDYFGNRTISICRELTKMYEESFLGTVSEALEYFSKTKPKGEFIIIVAKEGFEL